jgi:hypothetical protein
MFKLRPPIAEVVWLDANTTALGEHYTAAQAKECGAVKRRTVGYLLLSNKVKTIVATTWDQGDSENHAATTTELTVVPHQWVISVKILQKALKVTFVQQDGKTKD